VHLGVTSGKTLYQLPAPMLWFGSATWVGVPVDIWIAAIIYALVGLALRYTSVGRARYAVGGRALSARAAGIKDKFVVVTV
jgi:simple sugar transport system permease protein/ribose transport system permease protein